MLEILPKEDVQKLVLKFLCSCGMKYANDDIYYGEMISAAYLALAKFDPSRGLKPSTIIYKYCRNRFLTILKEEKSFYSRHLFCYPMDKYAAKTRTPYGESAFFESVALLEKSGLTGRCKEVIMDKLRHPSDTIEEIGERLGITRQAVSLHVISAQQYFKRNNVDIEC